MEYRQGTAADLDAICELIAAAIKEMEKHNIFQWDELYPARMDFEEDLNKGNLYVCLEDNRLAAVYVINREADEAYKKCSFEGSEEKHCLIHRFCVSPSFQNKGLGKRILKHIEDQAALMGYESIRLDAFSLNPYAMRLYENGGYITRGQANFRKGLFNLMEKEISVC